MDFYRVSSNELMHHGIQGQKWGVRRGPPYPIEDKVLNKGTRLNNVSPYRKNIGLKVAKKQKRWTYAYNPEDEWDSKVYKGPFSYYKNGNMATQLGISILKEHQYEVVKDLKMPTSKERIDAFIDLYKKMPSTVAKDLSMIQNVAKEDKIGSKEAWTVNLLHLKTDRDYKAAYELFNHAMENISNFASTTKYAKIMSKNYDAMVDDNNVNIYNRVHDPIIIFKSSSLKEIADTKVVTIDEIMKNIEEVANKLSENGELLKY